MSGQAQLKIALCSESGRVRGADLYRLARVLHAFAALVSPVWAPGAPLPEIKPIASRDGLPGAGWFVLLFVESLANPQALANHTPLAAGLPTIGRVYVNRGTGLARGSESWSESAAHEVAEIIANPNLTRWAEIPGRVGQDTPVEIADWSQETFELDVEGEAWPVANFMHPAAFGIGNPPGVRGYDHARTMDGAFGLRPSGFRVVRKRATGESWIETLSKGKLQRAELDSLGMAKRHPLSRTRFLVEQASANVGTGST